MIQSSFLALASLGLSALQLNSNVVFLIKYCGESTHLSIVLRVINKGKINLLSGSGVSRHITFALCDAFVDFTTLNPLFSSDS